MRCLRHMLFSSPSAGPRFELLRDRRPSIPDPSPRLRAPAEPSAHGRARAASRIDCRVAVARQWHLIRRKRFQARRKPRPGETFDAVLHPAYCRHTLFRIDSAPERVNLPYRALVNGPDARASLQLFRNGRPMTMPSSRDFRPQTKPALLNGKKTASRERIAAPN
jgi:hypothetical protein